MREEGFEGTDLATLAHLECLWMPMASRANQNEDIAYAIVRFFYISCFQASLSMRYKKNEPYRTRSSFWFAEREGFEPPEPLSSTVFKTAAIDHSAISPLLCRANLVRRMRLELTRSCDHYPLKVACIPISPPAHCAQNRTRTCTSLNTRT